MIIDSTANIDIALPIPVYAKKKENKVAKVMQDEKGNLTFPTIVYQPQKIADLAGFLFPKIENF